MKKVFALAFVVLGTAAVGITACSCGSGATPSLVGRWQMSQTFDGGAAAVTTLVFQQDGSMRMEVIASTSGLRNTGRWNAEGANLTFTFSLCERLDAAGAATTVACAPASAVATYSISADTLTLMTGVPGTDAKATTVLQRK